MRHLGAPARIFARSSGGRIDFSEHTDPDHHVFGDGERLADWRRRNAEFQRMTTALTGASGYVGSILAQEIADIGPLVKLLRRPDGADGAYWSFDQNEEQTADLLVQHGVRNLVHAAWDMRTADRNEAEATCVQGSLRLLRAARRAGVKRVIFISTISAFDDAKSIYGQTKREVERATLAEGGVVLRLGLVHGDGEGGMFGALRKSVKQSRIVPIIGLGRRPQFLLEDARLRHAVRVALSGQLDGAGAPITLAAPEPIPFRDVLERIAKQEGRKIIDRAPSGGVALRM
jgi:nucleoside-diphosphate-sugar epimerase